MPGPPVTFICKTEKKKYLQISAEIVQFFFILYGYYFSELEKA